MKQYLTLLALISLVFPSFSQNHEEATYEIFPFGENGNFKMTYDARQRPQCVLYDDIIYFAVNADTDASGKSIPVVTSFDLKTKEFSELIKLSDKYSKDHHDAPVIWMDTREKFHIFHAWHHEGGYHIKSKQPRDLGKDDKSWERATNPNDTISYPWIHPVYDGQYVFVYRTNEHFSSWTYRLSDDNGDSWSAPPADVIDLDILKGQYTDWSAYAAKAISNDGRYLHLAFIAYDDYKHPRTKAERSLEKLDKNRQQNPLYENRKINYKYNLYYVKVDLSTHHVSNCTGEELRTPIDWNTANEKCMIWDTQWRGGAVVPTMMVDDNDQVSFLHNISNEQHDDSLDYHYLRLENDEWIHNRITSSNHEWNSGYLMKSEDGRLHTYLITGNGYSKPKGSMDKHGGGNIEEWVSDDQGHNWHKLRTIAPQSKLYKDWKFNNVQPIVRADGSHVEGMLLFYGWKDSNKPEAKAFLYMAK